MKIELLVIGRTRIPWVREGEAYYEKRLKRFTRYTTETLAAEKGSDATQTIVKESKRVLEKLSQSSKAYTLLLSDDGNQYTSREFASRIEQIGHTSGPDLRFVIGGAYGVSDDIRSQVDEQMSLSPMTFPHELVRVIFLEQLYRAFTILRGEAYHHE